MINCFDFVLYQVVSTFASRKKCFTVTHATNFKFGRPAGQLAVHGSLIGQPASWPHATLFSFFPLLSPPPLLFWLDVVQDVMPNAGYGGPSPF